MPARTHRLPAGITRGAALICTARDHGAAGDGHTEDTDALQRAIDACHAAGGGRVVVPPGTYAIGTVELKSRVELHLERGALLQGIYNSPSYRPISPGEGPMTALVFARDAEDVAITGGGTIDGQGHRYWRRLDQPRSRRPDVEQVGVIQFWYDHVEGVARPNRLVAFLRCRRVELTGIRLAGAASWTCHLIACRGVKVRGIDILNPIEGPNTDGIDVDGSSDVLIADCTIQTGDDGIVLKTRRTRGSGTPIRNVAVTNCRIYSGCNALKIGTETEDDVENVAFSNCVIDSPADARPVERTISGIAIETVDGGSVRNVVCSNIVMMNARTPLFLRLGARLRGGRPSPGVLRGITLGNIIATGATHPSVIAGIPGHPIEDLQIHHFQVQTAGGGTRTPEQIGPVPEHPAAYPEVFMFGEVPASALYLRHVRRASLDACSFRTQAPDARPACFADDADDFAADAAWFNRGD